MFDVQSWSAFRTFRPLSGFSAGLSLRVAERIFFLQMGHVSPLRLRSSAAECREAARAPTRLVCGSTSCNNCRPAVVRPLRHWNNTPNHLTHGDAFVGNQSFGISNHCIKEASMFESSDQFVPKEPRTNDGANVQSDNGATVIRSPGTFADALSAPA